MTLVLAVCLAGLGVWTCLCAFYGAKITRAKKRLSQSGTVPPRAGGRFAATIALSAVLCLLPYLVLFRWYMAALFEGCAVLALVTVMRDRLSTLTTPSGDTSDTIE